MQSCEAAHCAGFLDFTSAYAIPNIRSKPEEPIDMFECVIFLFHNQVFVSSIPGPETRYSEWGFTWSLQISADISKFVTINTFKVLSTEWGWHSPWFIFGTYTVRISTGIQLSRLRSFAIPDEVIGFLIDLIFQPHYGPGVDSASNRNEYQESC
jgi:hypothetical protein